MPNTKLTWPALKNHMHYGKWIYFAIAISAYCIGSLLFTTTEYRPPAERKVDFQIVGYIGDVEPVQRVADGLLEDAQKADPTLEQIGVYNIQYSGDPETDTYGVQKFTVMIAAREGAVYIMNRETLEQLAGQGGLLPLEGYIDSGALDVSGQDLSRATFEEPPEKDDDPPTGITHVYGISCEDMERFLDPDIGFDTTDKFMAVMGYCPNPDTAVDVMQRLRAAMAESMPEPEPTAAPEPAEAAQ